MERYNRQIILPELGEEGQQRIQRAKVLIVGVGGLGSPVALYLTGAGVGIIGLMDDDVVSISNLQRQILYSEAEVGMPKAIQAKKRLEALNSSIQINAYPNRLTTENAAGIISQYDIVVDGCDNFATRYLINDTCVQLGKIYVYGAMPHPPKGVLGVTPGIVGCTEATEVLKIIGGYGEVLSGKLWIIDLKTMETHILSL